LVFVIAAPRKQPIAVGHSIDAAQHRDPAAQVGQTIEPALKRIRARLRPVVFDFDTHLRL
jgi:hypothetical protein